MFVQRISCFGFISETQQLVGIKTIEQIPKKIARALVLDKPKKYTGAYRYDFIALVTLLIP